MRSLLLTAAFILSATQAQAFYCPSSATVGKALGKGNATFRWDASVAQASTVKPVREVSISKALDKASPKIGSDSFLQINRVWKAPAGVSSDPEWQMDITLERGVFGDGALYIGAEVTYGGQLTCSYDFSSVGGLGFDVLKVDGIGLACLPANAQNWQIRIPADGALDAPAARCLGDQPFSCALSCQQM
jgi:hypothetical protein